MKCPFCAEEIQDAAILCRFCGAKKEGDRWVSPAGVQGASGPASKPASKPAGTFTIKTAGALLMLSAFFEVFSITSEVPLFGAMRGGVAAGIFHLIYAAVFLVMGIGLWVPKPWAPLAIYAGTAYYTLEKLVYLLDKSARTAELDRALSKYGALLGAAGRGSIMQLSVTLPLVMIGCWWGFAVYIYLRREYFARA